MDIIHIHETTKNSPVVEDGLFSAGGGCFRWRPRCINGASLEGLLKEAQMAPQQWELLVASMGSFSGLVYSLVFLGGFFCLFWGYEIHFALFLL